ncbi:biotin-dependent carboxyltransferase family protein [Photobacterium sanguinicancri]|uniref:Biotin-dependent carboxyltransferase family protein n=1 Tax=Photobacterium sanguinicancri TaxID=875932 RepID=A0AAW7Y3R2_9GAMM|nr:biotin-dependent carboxyltransferase family protein [Photobacterium sanguinicancri]MDO6542997.1 biotin-dependent carboxyltransferase family protein [Photobacterium sanguinicancri]
MATINVLKAGMHTLIQDAGRLGVAAVGLSQGGAADMHGYCWANYLLANDANAPQLEITFGQLSITTDANICCVLTGADCSATISSESVNGAAVIPWQTFILRQGETLSLGYPRAGLRTYLAVKGGFNVVPVRGSVSTVVRNQLGGLLHEKQHGQQQGLPLAIGDQLSVSEEHHVPNGDFLPLSAPSRCIPDYSQPLVLRVVESYQAEKFSSTFKTHFYTNSYTVSPHSDRMGCRFDGESLGEGSQGIISEGIAYGAVQLPPDGLPIVMMNDRQTLGGYPKIGCVARVDMAKLAQSPPGKVVRFQRGDVSLLTQEWQQFSRFFGLSF